MLILLSASVRLPRMRIAVRNSRAKAKHPQRPRPFRTPGDSSSHVATERRAVHRTQMSRARHSDGPGVRAASIRLAYRS